MKFTGSLNAKNGNPIFVITFNFSKMFKKQTMKIN
jgi:hypothetical protein